MKSLSLKSKTLISVILFVLIAAALICVATFYDLQVSNILTKNILHDGQYLADDFFGVAGEIFGSAPVFLLIGFCAVMLFWYFERIIKLKPLRYVMSAIFFIVGAVAFWFFVKDIMKYILEHAGDEAYNGDAAVIAAQAVIGILINVLAVFAFKNFNDETVKKLAKFAIVAVLAIILANVIIAIVKNPIGRMRYRAMYAENDFSRYTEWYVINGKRVPTAEEVALYGLASDAFKSFPSGHTCAAGMTYALIMIPDIFEIKNKWAKLSCWALPIAFTGVVAISRIAVGAHYMSDVTFGGTIAFVSMLLMREIFICKGSHFKALFSKKNSVVVTETEFEEA